MHTREHVCAHKPQKQIHYRTRARAHSLLRRDRTMKGTEAIPGGVDQVRTFEKPYLHSLPLSSSLSLPLCAQHVGASEALAFELSRTTCSHAWRLRSQQPIAHVDTCMHSRICAFVVMIAAYQYIGVRRSGGSISHTTYAQSIWNGVKENASSTR